MTTCADVKVLTIHNWQTTYQADEPPNLSALHLSQLTCLNMSGVETKAISTVLAMVHLPPSASFDLECEEFYLGGTYDLLRRNAWLRDSLFSGNLDHLHILSSTYALEINIGEASHYDLLHHTETPLEIIVYGVAKSPEETEELHWDVCGNYQDGQALMAQRRTLSRLLSGLHLIVRPTLITRMRFHLADWLFHGLRRGSMWRPQRAS